MKVTTYAPPFRPPFFRSLENLYSFHPFILTKMRKLSYFDPCFSSKLGKMYSFNPLFFTLVVFRVDGRWWTSLSEIWPSTPPPPPPPTTTTTTIWSITIHGQHFAFIESPPWPLKGHSVWQAVCSPPPKYWLTDTGTAWVRGAFQKRVWALKSKSS